MTALLTDTDITTIAAAASVEVIETVDTDPITTEIIRGGLFSAAEQMRHNLKRKAYSPAIYEMLDFCAALYNDKYQLLAQAECSPIFLGSMAYVVESSVRSVGGAARLSPGDVIWSTYGYDIGSHPQDATVVVPAFHDDTIIGYATIKAHQMDIGAKEPYLTDSTDNFQEGTIFPGVFLYRGGELQEDIYRTILANSRLPLELAGDLRAQVLSADLGAQGLVRLVSKYGVDRFGQATQHMFNHGETEVRVALESIPNGKYRADGAMDSDGLTDTPVPISIAVEVEDGEVVVDFTDGPPVAAGPINCPWQTTVASALVGVLTLIGGGSSLNEGHLRPVSIRTRRNSMFHPEPPAPIFLYGWSAIAALDLIPRALSEVLPRLVPTGSAGDPCGIVMWGTRSDTGKYWGAVCGHPSGQGATWNGDGGSPLIHIATSGTETTPVEVVEHRAPLLIRHLELAPDSAGQGQYRGGVGVDAVYEALDNAYVTTTFERCTTPPWGLNGGKPGRPNSVAVIRPNEPAEIANKKTGVYLPTGTRLELRTGGGGGWGDVDNRTSEAIDYDRRQGYVTQ